MITNCMVIPKDSYKNRLFTTGAIKRLQGNVMIHTHFSIFYYNIKLENFIPEILNC